MSYGHADKIAAIVGRAQAAAAKPAPPIDPALYQREDVRRILADRDIAGLYRVLKDEAITQRQIAELTGQSQSEVSEILAGRRVKQVDVLERICDGLGIERGWMRLGSADAERSAYAREDEAAWKAVTDEMRRRALLAAAGAAALSGHPLLGELVTLPVPAQAPLPSRLGMTDVAEVDSLTGHVDALARECGGQAGAVLAVVDHSMRLRAVPAAPPVAARLGSELARLCTLAGWCCADSGLDDHARHYFGQAVELAGKVGDAYWMASALRFAGAIERELGHPNDAIKLFQLGQFKLMKAPGDDPRIEVVAAWLEGESALALADMSHEQAPSALARARDGWEAPDSFERSGMDELTARVYLDLGRLDVAESYAAGAVRAWGSGERRNGVLADITFATIHVKAGEPDGLRLAKGAIDGAALLRSVRARERWLEPLAAALEARRGSDARELARRARQAVRA
ncbi:MAG: helix-turn-helix transcriptional regulator [Actinomycetota bacterium]|nr:helix-turn-helix transcriptional regulator [Actinomycetota bacterium]